MSSTTNSKTQSEPDRSWLKPDQVNRMRSATVNNSASYLSSRNDAIIVLIYDSGLRVGELVQVTTEMFDSDDGVLRIPSKIQKRYPNGDVPPAATIEIDPGVVRALQMFLNSR